MSSYYVHPTSDCELGASVGAGTRIWRFCHVMAGAQIGRDCMLGQGCFVANGAHIGDRVRVQNQVSIVAGVILEDDVFCGPGVVFSNVSRPRAFVDQRAHFAATRIGCGATLGANATLTPGVHVGEYALVGAGAVVTRDVLPYAEVIGVPARQRGWVSRAGCALCFDENSRAVCARTGVHYLKLPSDNGTVKVVQASESRETSESKEQP